eukprot:scaffold478775_cov29-Prasinocladus_malaysianus.AAC.1
MAKGKLILDTVRKNLQADLHQPLMELLLLRRPKERVASRFHHDFMHGGAARVGCAQNAEDYLKVCLDKSMSKKPCQAQRGRPECALRRFRYMNAAS